MKKITQLYIARLVELARLKHARQSSERVEGGGKADPDRTIKLPSESRGGVTQIFIKVIFIMLLWKLLLDY